MDPFARLLAAVAAVALSLTILYGSILFFQHEADRDAAINQSRPPAAYTTCPDGSVVASPSGC